MVGCGGGSGLESSADGVYDTDHSSAEQKETSRFGSYFDLASYLSAGKVDVMNVGIGLSTVQGGDEVGLCLGNGTALLGDVGCIVGSGEGEVDGSVKGAGGVVWEWCEWDSDDLVDSDRPAAVDVGR